MPKNPVIKHCSQKWVQSSKQKTPDNETERIVDMILPAGNYGIKLIWADGEVMVKENMPTIKVIQADTLLEEKTCSGSVGLTVINPTMKDTS